MLKKSISLYLLLILFGIGENKVNYLKLAITSSEKSFYELSNKYLEQYIASGEKEHLDYVYLLYGYNLIKLENYDQAIKKFEIIIKEFPLSQYLKNAYLFLFLIYLKTDRIDSAINLYKEYREKFDIDENIEKQIGEKILQKGIELFKNKNIQDAKKYFSLITEKFKQKDLILWANYYYGLCEYQESNFLNAKDYFEKVIISGKGDIVSDSKLKLGDCYFNVREYEIAEKYYNELLNENSIFSQWAKFQLAIIEKRKGEIIKSLEILDGIDFGNDLNLMFKVLDEKANIYILLERWKEGEDILNLLINKFPSTKEIAEIYFKLGIVNFNKNEYDKSILFFKRAIELSQEDSIKEKSLFYIGYINYIKRDFNISFKYWQDLIEKYPESSFISQIYFLKGKKFYNENNQKQAEKFFKEVIKKDNSYKEQAITYLIEILINQDKLLEAENYAKEFLEKKQDKYINFLLGKIYYLQADYEKSKGIFENLNIDNPVFKVEKNFYLGKIYQKQGNIEKAKEKFIEIISLYPQHKEWKEKAEKSLKELKK